MSQNSIQDIVKDLSIILNNNIFKRSLTNARNNWLNISVSELINNVINYFNSI